MAASSFSLLTAALAFGSGTHAATASTPANFTDALVNERLFILLIPQWYFTAETRCPVALASRLPHPCAFCKGGQVYGLCWFIVAQFLGCSSGQSRRKHLINFIHFRYNQFAAE